jgi:predicted enzyme involved in methoxymalonyl-ACP biosynthesis
VLGRGFEREFAVRCINHAQASKRLPIRANHVPGHRNSQTSRFLDELGFRHVTELPGGAKVYELPVGTPATSSAPHVTFSWE